MDIAQNHRCIVWVLSELRRGNIIAGTEWVFGL